MQSNEAQNKAINHIDGPMLVLAGPGSGKTTVITRRVEKLIRHGINPMNILVITFTKAAYGTIPQCHIRNLSCCIFHYS